MQPNPVKTLKHQEIEGIKQAREWVRPTSTQCSMRIRTTQFKRGASMARIRSPMTMLSAELSSVSIIIVIMSLPVITAHDSRWPVWWSQGNWRPFLHVVCWQAFTSNRRRFSLKGGPLCIWVTGKAFVFFLIISCLLKCRSWASVEANFSWKFIYVQILNRIYESETNIK